MLSCAFVRAGVAHGTITNVDTSAAKESPGVVAVYTADDLGLNDLPNAGPPVPSPETMRRPILAKDKVRFIGEAIAVVVAETHAQAVDAVDLVEVDIDELPVLVDMTKALEDGAPILFDEAGTNLAAEAPLGAAGALDDAEVSISSRFVNQRLAAVPMEPAAAVAAPDPEIGGVRLWAPLQSPHMGQGALAGSLDLEPEKIRVTVPTVGGGFGARIATYPEQIALAAIALKLDTPVRYVESRWETMISMQHGRAQVEDVELGATKDGKITGIKLRVIADCGAYPADATLMPLLTGLMASGVYQIPKVDFAFQAVVTNTTPIGAYRGAGRPEATALLERAMDQLAVKLDMDPAELRRRNFIQPDAFPLTTVAGASYDSGEYEQAMDKVLENSGYHELRAQQAERRASGDPKQLGIGLATYVELTGMGSEIGTCIVDEDGKVTVSSGTSPQGQGHDTMFAAIVSDVLGVPMDDVIVVHSDTAKVPRGMGTMGSRSLQVGGSAVFNATNTVLDKGKQIAASLLEASAEDIDIVPGKGLGVKGSPDANVSWADLAKAAVDVDNLPEGVDPGLAAETDFATPDSSYPFGAHVSLVEVDTETGLTKLAAPHHGRRLRPHPQPAAGRGPDPRRHRAGRRAGPVRAHRVRRGRQLLDRLARVVRDPVGERPAELRDRAHADAEPAEPARGQGHRRVRRDRLDPGDLERRRRRRVVPGRQEHRHARAPRARLAGDRGREDVQRSRRLATPLHRFPGVLQDGHPGVRMQFQPARSVL